MAAATVLASLALASVASAHARLSPSVGLSGQTQLYSLAVPTEKQGLATTKLELTVPVGFSIDSFAPPPAGWHQQVSQHGSGDNAVVTKVTWTGGHTPTGQDSLFQFLGEPAADKSYAFAVRQTYSDGSIVNWTGPESSATPGPTVKGVASLGAGGGTSTLTIVALIVGILGLLAGLLALIGRGGRRLA
ncbi:MAG: DUF1775 domain-containing protein [Solirubrobacterales bacterium]|nr:DUF1775 domain-containing protein [Solirubrobacterales bacterium]